MSNKPAIPSQQRDQSPAPTSSSQPSEPDAAPKAQEAASTTDAGLLEEGDDAENIEETTELSEQVRRFLEDPTIRDAPREKKVAFLQSKGVASAEIDKLLMSVSVPESSARGIAEGGARAWSTVPPAPAQPANPALQARDIPPIVTYPEFLAQPTHDPPLITTRRLLNTTYIAGVLAATMYGLSKFIITPMSQNMAESRHDFAQHTQGQLDELNKRLREAASFDPETSTKRELLDAVDDESEADSDPTELFHRDYGTQTSPTLSRRPSVSYGTKGEDVTLGHEGRLMILTARVRELTATRSNVMISSESLKAKISDLNTYLGEMKDQNSYYSGMGNFYGGVHGLPQTKHGKDDQIETLKREIRAVKGVFLSAKNFPAGGRNLSASGEVDG